MAKKIKKTIPWFLVLLLIGLAVGIGLNLGETWVQADEATTSVTVGNVLPSITVPADDSSTCDSPTDVGSDVTFTATATDANGDEWKILVCETAGTTGVACTGAQWCVSSSVSSGSPASCSHTVVAGDYNNGAWFVYACDSTGCTADDNTYSPFNVNREPDFSDISVPAADPGQNIVFTATASDPDHNGDGCTADEVELYICDAAGADATSGCTGGTELCHAVLTGSNPTCDYSVTIPTAHGPNNYYPYVFDTHGMPAGAGIQGVAAQYTVNDVAPIVTSVILDDGGPIALNLKGSTTDIAAVSTDVTDNNGCEDITEATAVIYLTSKGDSCAADDNNCYQIDTGNCVKTACDGASDAVCTYTCTAALKYYADPTDTSSTWSGDTWSAEITASDESGSGSKIGDTPVDLQTNTALDVTETIAYGTVAAGQDTGSDNETTTVVNYGNSPIDNELYGIDMTGPATITIDVGQQHYALIAFTYGTGDTALKLEASKDTVDIEATKPTSTTPDVSDNILWGIEIPGGKASGEYTGTNTFTALVDTDDW
ncbi:unnamed protein product, partial [marine sediment metagenome]